MNNSLRLVTLGGLVIFRGEERITVWASRKAAALLVYLACNPRLHSREVLADLFWDGRTQRRAMSNLRVVLSSLRQQVGEFVDITRDQAGINLDAAVWLDTRELETAVKQPLTSETIGVMETAVSLYQGEFLEGFYLRDSSRFEEWMLTEREQLHRLTVTGLQKIVDWCLAQDILEAGISHAERLHQLDPLLEDAHQNLIRLLALTGQRSQALAQYEKCRQLLWNELGVEPTSETQALHNAIVTGGLTVPKKTLLDYEAPLHNFPTQTTPFIGREEELASLETIISDPDTRLVSIIGPGGSGKTRLAIALAERLLATQSGNAIHFPDGIYFVPLNSLDTSDQIAPSINAALGFQPQLKDSSNRTLQQQLIDYLRRKQLLLILDNIEHLLSGAELLTSIVQAAPNVQLLVTSRERLSMRAEQSYPLAGLDYPEVIPKTATDNLAADYAAIALFLQSVRRLLPGFKPDLSEISQLVQLCQLVAGMPLALELAAGWAESLSLREIVCQVKEGLDIFKTDWRDIPDRHRGMTAVFDATWSQLDETDRTSFMGLTVFSGGFNRQAATAITGVGPSRLASLIRKSLLLYDAAHDRYQIHRLLRQYGWDKLVNNSKLAAAINDSHSAYYCNLVTDCAEACYGPQHRDALHDARIELANYYKAWRWSIRHKRISRSGAAITGLCMLYDRLGLFHEGELACRMAVELFSAEMNNESHLLLARALIWQGIFCPNLMESHRLLQRSLGVLADVDLSENQELTDRALALCHLGITEAILGNIACGRKLVRQSLALYEGMDDSRGQIRALTKLSEIDARVGEYEQAEKHCCQCLALCRQVGDRLGAAESLMNLGNIYLHMGHLDEAQNVLEESEAIFRKLNDRRRIGWVLDTLSGIHNNKGRMEESLLLMTESRNIALEFGDPTLIAHTACMLGYIKLDVGDYEGSRYLALECKAICQENLHCGDEFVHIVFGKISLVEQDDQAARDLLSDGLVHCRKIEFRLGEAISLALLSLAERNLGHFRVAKECLILGLEKAMLIQNPIALYYLISVGIILYADRELLGKAKALHTSIWQEPRVANSVWFKDVIGRELLTIFGFPPQITNNAGKLGRHRCDIWETAESLLDELSQSN